MTDVITSKTLVIPPNFPPALGFETQFSLGWSEVEQVLLSFPPGCAGLVGARVEYSENAVYPNSESAWFVFDDVNLPIMVTNQQKAGQWSIKAYNNDIYTHSLTVSFWWNYLPQSQIQAQSPLVSL